MKNDTNHIPSRAEMWGEVLKENGRRTNQLREMTYQIRQLALWFDAKIGVDWRWPDDKFKFDRAMKEVDTTTQALMLENAARAGQRCRQWLVAHAPELLPEKDNFGGTEAVEAVINLLEFYMYGPDTEPKSAVEQMEEEASTGKMLRSEEIMVRLMNEAIDQDTCKETIHPTTFGGSRVPGFGKEPNPSERFKKR